MENIIAEIGRLCFRLDVVIDMYERQARMAGAPPLNGPNAAQQNAYLAQIGQQPVQQQPVQQLVQQQPAMQGNQFVDPAAQQFAQNQQFAQQPVQQFAQQPVQQGAVTDAMILELAGPLSSDERARPMLQAEMNAMGIATLPDTRPDQYAELYQRFVGVKQRIEVERGGMQQQPVQQFQQQPVQQFQQQPVQQFQQQPVQQFQQQPVQQGVQNIV